MWMKKVMKGTVKAFYGGLLCYFVYFRWTFDMPQSTRYLSPMSLDLSQHQQDATTNLHYHHNHKNTTHLHYYTDELYHSIGMRFHERETRLKKACHDTPQPPNNPFYIYYVPSHNVIVCVPPKVPVFPIQALLQKWQHD